MTAQSIDPTELINRLMKEPSINSALSIAVEGIHKLANQRDVAIQMSMDASCDLIKANSRIKRLEDALSKLSITYANDVMNSINRGHP